ncbi:hypothetical protein LTR36_000854 [Oleoguttula mirabilis]|uniref:Uncharacterized protein n=1 Tax=Oleoguttula mirabilis TaxID=1507867 RepID=A0AAV9J316_9PEZI|nr:hypothetical protein LTR36_000854 [Oleoguttula mirabilis]
MSANYASSPLFVAQPPVNDEGVSRIRCVLVANRGEIACRVIATCQKLNIRTVAVYVQEDALSRHVGAADQAVDLGSISQGAGNPYLSTEVIIEAAVKAKADAVHPGYGYMSENPAFADAVRTAGLVFIGPSAASMSTLGDKRSAKAYLREHDPSVPLIPGFAGSGQAVSDFEKAADAIGYPVMLKASAGGGGKGMRVVRRRSDLRGELETVQSEASRFFGSSDCILEKYIEAAKHIEIQILGDSHGGLISLWERECSVQRRHQKIIEETPSPSLDARKRQEISDTAVRIGKLLGYENAGTVEFVFDVSDGRFYFLEVNTRLQVEHPITEEVTRIDIVALQLFVAAGGKLATLSPLDKVPQRGHAIECRLCAEDPQQNFYPQHGTIRLWKPAELASSQHSSVRFESAVETGSAVSIHFDSMVAKVIVWAPTRAMAIQRMVAVLAHTVCAGVRTNQLFLQSCLLHSGFRDPAYTTSFIPQNLSSLLIPPHADAWAQMAPTLPLVACYFLRNLVHDRKPFANVRRGFRNQLADPISGHKDIVVTRNAQGEMQTLLCTWTATREPLHGSVQGQIAHLPTAENDIAGGSSSTASALAAQYNAVSNAMRTGSLTGTQHHNLTVEKCHATVHPSPTTPSWICATLTILVDGSRYPAYLATESRSPGISGTTQVGERQRVMCHLPALGTWVDISCYSPLCFFESLRATAAAGSDALVNTAVAPMPCKVLSVLKKNGDVVKAGENVIVVESMKMEMNIAISAGGVFEALVSKDDAVEEGAVLCRVT